VNNRCSPLRLRALRAEDLTDEPITDNRALWLCAYRPLVCLGQRVHLLYGACQKNGLIRGRLRTAERINKIQALAVYFRWKRGRIPIADQAPKLRIPQGLHINPMVGHRENSCCFGKDGAPATQRRNTTHPLEAVHKCNAAPTPWTMSRSPVPLAFPPNNLGGKSRPGSTKAAETTYGSGYVDYPT